MSIADKLTTVAENQQKVYDAGREAGVKREYDKFWDVFQNDGKPQNYYYAFAYDRWTDKNYNPKYDIVGKTSLQNVFYASAVTDTKVTIDTNSCTNLGGIFYWARTLVTVRKLKITSKVTAAKSAFAECFALKNITINGVIACDWDMSPCPLTANSIMSVFNALSTTVTGKTVTFKQTAVNAAFTDAEWEALKATKPNWTYALA